MEKKYVLHPTIRNKLAIDPEAASVVRKIFLLAIDGNTSTEIAIRLNDEGIPTPAQYFIKRHPDTKKYRHSSDKLNWTHAAIHRTLTKLVYTGCAVGHERRIVAPLSRKTAKQDIEKQFVVENMHEAIVSREEYDLAQAAIRKTGRSPAKASNYPLRSLIRCGNCGRRMTFLKSKKGFFCSYGRTDRNSVCPTEAIYTVVDIEQRIYDVIMLFLSAEGEKCNLSNKLLKKKKTEIQKNMDALTDFQKQREKLKKQKLKSYEQYSIGSTTKQTYLDEKSIIDEKICAIGDSISETEQRIAALESMEETDPQKSQDDRFLNEPSLTYDMAHAFVENSNPAIIPRETFMAAQKMQEMKKTENCNRGGYPLSKLIKCPDCGHNFRRQVVRGTAYWICSYKASGRSDCRSIRLRENDVYAAFTELTEKLTENRQYILGDLLRQMTELRLQTSENQQKIYCQMHVSVEAAILFSVSNVYMRNPKGRRKCFSKDYSSRAPAGLPWRL